MFNVCIWSRLSMVSCEHIAAGEYFDISNSMSFLLLLRPLQFHWIMKLWVMIYEGAFFSFDLVLCLVAVLIVPGGFKGGWRFIVLRFPPPWAELADSSPVFEKRGVRAGDFSPWLDPRPPDLWVLAGKAEILARSPPPLPFGTRVPDCSLAGELVAAFFAGRGLLVPSSELSPLKVLLLLIVSISISFSSSFEAADCRADSVFRIVVSFFCSGVACGGGGDSSEEGASRGTGFSGVISSNVSNRVRQ